MRSIVIFEREARQVKKRFNRFLLEVLPKVLENLLGLVIPTYNHGRSISTIKAPPTEDRKNRLGVLRKSLFWNLTFLMEMRFRYRLYRLVLLWELGEIEYYDARKRLDEIIGGRSRIASHTIPSHGLAKSLRAFGFFSSSQQLVIRGFSRISYRPIAAISILWFFLSRPLSSSSEIVGDIWKNSCYKNHSFQRKSEEFITGSFQHNIEIEAPRTALIIAPGPVFEPISPLDFDVVFSIMNSGATSQGLMEIASQSKVHLVIRGALTRKILDSSDLEEWIRALNSCQMVYCPNTQVAKLQGILEVPVRGFSNPVTKMWGFTGEPNLVQITLGLALQILGKAPKIAINGATFYASSQIYAVSEIESKRSSSSNFATSQNLAKHDIAVNFTVTQRLTSLFDLTGSKFATDVLSMEVEDYLRLVDSQIGKNRL